MPIRKYRWLSLHQGNMEKEGGQSMTETCISCGAEIPEGRQVCPKCERRTMQDQRYLENPMVSGDGFPIEKEEITRCVDCGKIIKTDILGVKLYTDKQGCPLCESCNNLQRGKSAVAYLNIIAGVLATDQSVMRKFA